MCEETVWLPGPPQTQYSGPHYCGLPSIGTYLVHGQFKKELCETHAKALGSNAVRVLANG